MDDRDLQLLRAFRAEEAEPPADLQARIEERLWQAVLAEEAARAPRRRATTRRSWLARMSRPFAAAAAAGALALGVAVASDGGAGRGTLGQARVQQAGVLDATASALFGGSAASTNDTRIVGRIDLSDGDASLVEGPRHDASGQGLDESHAVIARDMTRDPDELLRVVRESVAAAGVADSGDALAFHVAMRWVVDPAVPVDLRAAMLRSVEGIDGIDDALAGADVLGRTGVVVGHLDRPSGIRSQYVLDPADGSLLEMRAFTTAYLDPGCPPGTVTAHAAFEQDGSRVDPAAARWVDWPQVVDACAPTYLVTS